MSTCAVINRDELDQFIADYKVNVNKSKLESQIQQATAMCVDACMIFLVCDLENGGITMKNFILRFSKT